MLTKKQIGKAIPYPLIETGRKIIHAGSRECKVCRSRVRSFHDSGYGFEVLERLQVVGGLRRFADGCPVCHSTSRERLIWFWLSQAEQSFRFSNNIAVAHFAPEKGLTERLKSAVGENYTAYDFEPSRYRHLSQVKQADLSNLTIDEGSVDLLICNHVLEHVPDVSLALNQIHKVLKPAGVAVLQVPLALKLQSSIELPSNATAEHRIESVGQDDHLRLFTPAEYGAQIKDSGFDLERFDAFEWNSSSATDWMLDPFELLYVCHKPRAV